MNLTRSKMKHVMCTKKQKPKAQIRNKMKKKLPPLTGTEEQTRKIGRSHPEEREQISCFVLDRMIFFFFFFQTTSSVGMQQQNPVISFHFFFFYKTIHKNTHTHGDTMIIKLKRKNSTTKTSRPQRTKKLNLQILVLNLSTERTKQTIHTETTTKSVWTKVCYVFVSTWLERN